MPAIPSHLLKRAKSTWNKAATLFKDSSTGHLLRELPLRVFTPTGVFSEGRYAYFETERGSSRTNFSKSHGITGLHDCFDNDPSSNYISRNNPEVAYVCWGNVTAYNQYWAAWEAVTGCLAFSQPAAKDFASTGRHRSLTYVKSVTISVATFSVIAGAGQTRVAVILSPTSTMPSTLSAIQSSPYIAVSGTGDYTLDMHVPGQNYIIVVPYFTDLIPPDNQLSRLDQMDASNTASFSLATSISLEYETEDEALAAIQQEESAEP